MSRTYRKRAGENPWWLLRDYVLESELTEEKLKSYSRITPYRWGFHRKGSDWVEDIEYQVRYTEKSKEGRKLLARHHSDAGTYQRNPGPHDYKNLYTIRPYRRKYKEQCRKAMFVEDFELVLEPIRYMYWD